LHAIVNFFAQLTSPLWRFTRERPWLAATLLGVASAICFLEDIHYVRTILGLGACSVLIAKSERDLRQERALAASGQG
jgi:hypothetical protein